MEGDTLILTWLHVSRLKLHYHYNDTSVRRLCCHGQLFDVSTLNVYPTLEPPCYPISSSPPVSLATATSMSDPSFVSLFKVSPGPYNAFRTLQNSSQFPFNFYLFSMTTNLKPYDFW